MSDYLTKRNGFWQFVRRVPPEYAELEPRGRAEREPGLIGDDRLDALVGAIAEYLAKQRRLGRVPPWVSNPARRLTSPWFAIVLPSDAMREYLTFSSPAEFASRNIFTEERPLRRSRGPHPAKT
jgi:hypothetical protein